MREPYPGDLRRPALRFCITLLLALMVTSLLIDAAHAATIEPSHGRERVVVAIAALNKGTEVTDFLVPYGILAEAGAEVLAVAPEAAPVTLWPAGRIAPHMDFAGFDAAHEAGADIVIIPAMVERGDEAVLNWLRDQAAKGALMVSICEGSSTLAETGLLDGRHATGHFYEHENRVRRYPHVEWQRNIRYVEDGNIISSSGVSASLPVSLLLAERIAGRGRAAEIAAHYGVENWSAEHNSDAFNIGMREMATATKNLLLGWPRADILIAVHEGVSEVDLAFPLDFASRSWKSETRLFADKTEVTTRHGLTLLADVTGDAPKRADVIRLPGDEGKGSLEIESAATLREEMLAWIGEKMGSGTAHFVAVQLEYPVPGGMR
ncbi:DJ-1/PfpI family protein [Parvibaculum sp.]|jgi:transcriptional regulator GlxA family with amidase domain|uniref:DJ-1/PfpI family protein n=1 Tax=Parvibaculum sp. TaxID=2024848 RepID=UPI00391CEAE6